MLVIVILHTASSMRKYHIVSFPDRAWSVSDVKKVRSDYAPGKYSMNRGSYREKPRGVEENLVDPTWNLSVCNPHSRGSYHIIPAHNVQYMLNWTSQKPNRANKRLKHDDDDIVPYFTPRGNTVRTVDHIVLYRSLFMSYRVVSYWAGFAICIVLYRSWFVSYRIVLHVKSYRTDTILTSCCTFLDRIKIPFLWFGSYPHFSQIVSWFLSGRIVRHNTILGAWSVPIRIVMPWSDTYLWNWL
jgi:hypothetical protein